jgi:hypothetical protein
MAVTHTLQANFTQSIGKSIALPAGTTTMVFFGTAGDGVETNRVAGGPALSVLAGTPVHSANYVSVGLQAAGTRNDVIDTNNFRDASMLAAGWTWMAVAKTPYIGANFVPVVTDQNLTGAPQVGNEMGFGFLQGSNRMVLFATGISNRASLVLTNSIATTWHIFGYTYAGGGGIGTTCNLWEFTENQAGQSVTYNLAAAITAQPAMSPHFGITSVEGAGNQSPTDVAWGLIAKGVLSQATMSALAASVRPWLARRGITM